jgi:hypothetical protein
LTYELWIGLWQKAFCENPKRAFKFLVYTGYIGGKMKDVIQPIQIRTRDILGKGNQHRRFVFNCFVIGHSGSGKTAFLESAIKSGENNRMKLNPNLNQEDKKK